MQSDTGDGMDPEVVCRLLALGLGDDRRVIDLVIDQLRGARGAAWGERVLARWSEAVGIAPDAWFSDAFDLSAIEALRARCKAAAADATTNDEALGPGLVYLLCAALGLVHHGRNLTSRTDEDLLVLMIGLAEAVQPSWKPLFEQAGVALSVGE